MYQTLPRIDQNEIGKIYKKILETRELYVEKPIVIWRSYFKDGILYPKLQEIREAHNKNRKKEEKEYFRIIGLEVKAFKDKDFEVSLNPEKYKACVIYIDIPQEELQNPHPFDTDLGKFISEWLKKIRATLKVPMILHLPYIEHPDTLEGIEVRQYIFNPNYEEWKKSELNPNYVFDILLLGFLDSFKSHQEKDYSWYWYFHRSPDWKPEWYIQTLHEGTGCNFPSCWSDGLHNLRWNIYLPMAQIPKNYKPRKDILISEMSTEKFKSFFADGISYDLIEKFRNYLIEHHDRWEDPYK